MGVVDLLAGSLGADVGLGAKLPQFHNYATDNYFKDRALKLQEQDRADKEAQSVYKDYTVDWNKTDPMDQPRLKKAIADFQNKWLPAYAKDNRVIHSPEYQQSVQDLINLKGEIYQNKPEYDMYRKSAYGKDFRPVDPQINDAIMKGDATTFNSLTGGKTAFVATAYLKPNVDIDEIAQTIAKTVKPSGKFENPLPQDQYKGYGKVSVNKVMTRNPTDIVESAGSTWDNDIRVQAAWPDKHAFTASVLEKVAGMDTVDPVLVSTQRPTSNSGFTGIIGGEGNNGRFAAKASTGSVTIAYPATKTTVSATVLDNISKLKNPDGLIASLKAKGLGTDVELNYLKGYALADANDRAKMAIPTLSTTKYTFPYTADKRYNIQQMASGDNKKLSWSTNGGKAFDANTGASLKKSVVDGELMDVVHITGGGTGGNKGSINPGWYAVVYNLATEKSSAKTYLIPYNNVSADIETYTVGKNGLKGFNLYRDGVIQGAQPQTKQVIMQDANGKTFNTEIRNGKWVNAETGEEIK